MYICIMTYMYVMIYTVLEFVYVYECDWNYRPDHCMYMSVCKDAEVNGISVLHGNRGVLHNDQHPQFKAIYEAFNEVRGLLYYDWLIFY